jgi:hypothetical protein
MNVDRRALLKSGAAASAAVAFPGLSAAAANAIEPGIERFVVDSRFAEAVEAGRAAAAQGVALSEVNGDMTSLWYDDLNLRWRQRPMSMAGVTAEDALFVLETLAPEYRMRVVQRQELGLATVVSRELSGALPLYAWVIAPAS